MIEQSNLAPGAIFACSWGYEQTNVDFYRVEKLAGEWLTLRKVESRETSDGEMSMTGRAMPAEPLEPIGEPFRRKLKSNGNEPFVMIASYAYAYPWDGRPKRTSSYG